MIYCVALSYIYDNFILLSRDGGCTSACCMDIVSPNQPKQSAVLQKGGRSLNPHWYKEFPWIHYCNSRKRVFCYYCVSAYEKGLLTSHPKTAFFVEGFQNWKKAVERFQVHEGAECHREAKLKLCLSKAPTIAEQLNVQAAKTKAENRRMLLKLISSLKYLLRQGLAIRGHCESEGNLYQLLSLRCEDDPLLKRWLQQQQYLSHEVINEIITLLGNTLLRELLAHIREAFWFSVMADETADIPIRSSYQSLFDGLTSPMKYTRIL